MLFNGTYCAWKFLFMSELCMGEKWKSCEQIHFRERHWINLFYLTFLRVQLWPLNVCWWKRGEREQEHLKECILLLLSFPPQCLSCLTLRISFGGKKNRKAEKWRDMDRGKSCFHNAGMWFFVCLSWLWMYFVLASLFDDSRCSLFAILFSLFLFLFVYSDLKITPCLDSVKWRSIRNARNLSN